MNEQLTTYFEDNNLLTESQYGIRKNHSTTYLTLDLFDKLFDSKSKSNTPAIIFSDINKAFDVLIMKFFSKSLSCMELMALLFFGLKIHLTNRQQCTKLHGCKSIYLLILCGVPQGSLLGPLSFSIYINDLVNACNLSHPYLFADDGLID